MIILSSLSNNRTAYKAQAAIAACLLSCVLLASVAYPSLAVADDTQSRLRQLEGSVDTLNRAVFKGEKPPVDLSASAPSSDYQASVETRLGDLEKQIRDLTGKVEQQGFENAQLKTKLDKALADIELRFQDANAAPLNSASSNTASSGSGPLSAPLKQTGTLSPNDMGG